MKRSIFVLLSVTLMAALTPSFAGNFNKDHPVSQELVCNTSDEVAVFNYEIKNLVIVYDVNQMCITDISFLNLNADKSFDIKVSMPINTTDIIVGVGWQLCSYDKLYRCNRTKNLCTVDVPVCWNCATGFTYNVPKRRC